jgi:hypothetical protein
MGIPKEKAGARNIATHPHLRVRAPQVRQGFQAWACDLGRVLFATRFAASLG